MESAVVKHSIVIAGHRTSVSLEKEFWNALKEIAHTKHMTLSDLVVLIDSDRQHANLSSAIRLFVLGFYRDQNWLGGEPTPERAYACGWSLRFGLGISVGAVGIAGSLHPKKQLRRHRVRPDSVRRRSRLRQLTG